MKAKLYLDNKPDQDGNAIVFVLITGSNKRVKVTTGIKVNPENWTGSQVKQKEPSYQIKNAIFSATLQNIENLIAEAQIKQYIVSPEQIKKAYQEKLSKKQTQNIQGNHPVTEYIEYYQELYSTIRKQSTTRMMNQVKGHIEKFDPAITIEDINHTWLVSYCSYLINEDIQDSTIKSRHLKTIKQLADQAKKEGIKISDDIFKFKWKSQPKQPFYATWDEVTEMMKLTDFVSKVQEQARDLFILSAHTGLRESDLSAIMPENFLTQQGQTMMKLTVRKTNFSYTIPISKSIIPILAKYGMRAPKLSQQAYNSNLKIVAQRVVKGEALKAISKGGKIHYEKLPRYKMFSTHTARRTFGRRFLDKGGNIVILSKILGQSDPSITMIYIGYQPEEVLAEFTKVFG